MLLVAQMVGELRLQRALHERSREALEKPLRTRQVLGLRVSRQQLVEQLAADLLVFLHRRPFPRRNDRPWRASSARYTEFLTGSYAAIVPWVERVAQQANLCLSFAHLLELENWGDRNTARAMVEWYDGLPTVWTLSRHDDAHEFESEHWTKV